MLRNQGSSSDEESIYDKLSVENDGCKLKMAAIYIFLMVFFGGYFIEEYFMFESFNEHIESKITHFQLIYANLNSLKMMQLYSL